MIKERNGMMQESKLLWIPDVIQRNLDKLLGRPTGPAGQQTKFIITAIIEKLARNKIKTPKYIKDLYK